MQLILIISEIVSTLTILSCVFLKIPQIRNMVAKKTAEGISISALLMEIAGYTIVILYNITNRHSVMTYLEYPIILLQIFIMLYYTLLFKNLLDDCKVWYSLSIYISMVISFLSGKLPHCILCFSMPFVTPINGMAKVSHIYGIIKAGNSHGVSITTWIISLLTNLGRLFTIYVDSADPMLIFNLAVSSSLSAWMLVTVIRYRIAPVKDAIQDETQEPIEKQREKLRGCACGCGCDKGGCTKLQHNDKRTKVRRYVQ